MPQTLASVTVLKPGYARWEGYASQCACGTITLVDVPHSMREELLAEVVEWFKRTL